jgi:hypothetical protein
MKVNSFLFGLFIPFAVLFCFTLFNCNNEKEARLQKPVLDVPENIKVEVMGRWLTVSWDTVSDADGYKILTTSADCGTGNRIVNTRTKVVTSHNGNARTNVDISPTSIRILLMPSDDDETMAMTSSVSARVMAITAGKNYISSGYSDEITISKENYLPAAE